MHSQIEERQGGWYYTGPLDPPTCLREVVESRPGGITIRCDLGRVEVDFLDGPGQVAEYGHGVSVNDALRYALGAFYA